VITLFQAEWCPHSSKVRERLTELGVDFVARQVEPWPEQRTEVDEIPTLETEDGERISGEREILRYLDSTFEPWRHEAQHRERFVEHRR
jgi:glutathione S-transferase